VLAGTLVSFEDQRSAFDGSPMANALHGRPAKTDTNNYERFNLDCTTDLMLFTLETQIEQTAEES
jgi:hypothetical protein